jgi:hypothetical protein
MCYWGLSWKFITLPFLVHLLVAVKLSFIIECTIKRRELLETSFKTVTSLCVKNASVSTYNPDEFYFKKKHEHRKPTLRREAASSQTQIEIVFNMPCLLRLFVLFFQRTCNVQELYEVNILAEQRLGSWMLFDPVSDRIKCWCYL